MWTDQTGAAVTRGDNLHGTITLDPASISPANPAKPEDVTLAARLLKSGAVTVDGRTSTLFTAKQGTQAVRVTTTVTWPDGTVASDNAAKRGNVVLADLSFTVTQTLD